MLQKTFEKAMIYLGIIAVPITFGVLALARPLILKVYTPEYEPSILTLQYLALSLLFLFLNFPLGSLLNACNRQVRNTVHIGIVMAINIILNIILIPKLSYLGAAISSSVSTFIMFILQMVVARQITPFSGKLLVTKFALIIISGLVMYLALIYLLPLINFVILIPVGAVVYLTVLYLIRGVNREDLLLLRRSFLRR